MVEQKSVPLRNFRYLQMSKERLLEGKTLNPEHKTADAV